MDQITAQVIMQMRYAFLLPVSILWEPSKRVVTKPVGKTPYQAISEIMNDPENGK